MSDIEHCCKVSRVAEKYDITPGAGDESLDEQLAKRWVGDREYPKTSLRTLVDWFHKHLLRACYTEHGRSTLEPHLESDYEALQPPTDDAYHAVLADLETDGINGEAITNDFISSTTLYRHLTNCLGVEKEDNEPQDSDRSDRDKLDYVENTAEMYIGELLSAWENREEVPHATEADIAIRIYLECPVCAKQTNVRTVRQRGYICETHMPQETESAGTDTT